MQVKDMYLKNNKFLFLFFVVFFFFIKYVNANETEVSKLTKYFLDLRNFSISFLQDDGNEISEGKISVGDKRVRIDYKTPTKITIILDNKKGMYYNYELDEDEFFNTKDTPAKFFFDMFMSVDFFLESEIEIKNNNLILIKKGINNEKKYQIKIYFEYKPLIIRKIELLQEDFSLTMSFFGHNYNNSFPKKYFKLINPSLFN